MPELPEVQTIVDDLCRLVKGRRIVQVRVYWPGTIAQPSPATFRRKLVGRTILDIARRGKYIVFHLSPSGFILTHLRMSGKYLVESAKAARPKHAHVVFELDDGRELRYVDARKFGRMHWVEDVSSVTEGLGPEPLSEEFTVGALVGLLDRRKGRVKSLLLNQRFIAGIGNIYADEALYHARVHPLRRAESLTRAEAGALHAAIQKVLRASIAQRGTSIDGAYRDAYGNPGANRSIVYGREGKPCPRCGAKIRKIVVGQRGTHFCPKCQK